MLHRLHLTNRDIEGEQLFSLSYNININQDNDLKYGTVASANLNFSSNIELARGTQFQYYVTQNGQSEKLVGKFFVAKISKTNNTYNYVCYDKLSQQGLNRDDYKSDYAFTYVTPQDGIVYGTYGLVNQHTFTTDEYIAADIALYTCEGEGLTYTPVTVEAFSDCGLSVGDKFTIDGATSYVMSISWDGQKVTISSTGTDPYDNAPSQIDYLDSTVLQQGQQITALTVEQGRIQALVERKNAAYRQGTIPADDDGTNYDLLNTGDLWFCTANIYDQSVLVYEKDKWYMCTAIGSHEQETRQVTWTETTDAEISDAISRITVAEGRITAEVSARTQADTNLNGRIDTTNTNVSRIDQTVSGISTTVASHTTSIQTLDGEVEDLGDAVDGLSTIVDDHESRIVQTADDISAEVTRATNAENGKINNTGYLTKTGYRWHLTDTEFTVDSKDGNNWKTVMTVNDNGLSVEGDVQADTGHIGNFVLDNGWLKSNSGSSASSPALSLGNGQNWTYLAAGYINETLGSGQTISLAGNTISNNAINPAQPININASLNIQALGSTVATIDYLGHVIIPNCMGTTLPSSGTNGQIFFLLG